MAYKSKEDQAASGRRHYENNKEKIKERAISHRKAKKSEIHKYILEYLLKHPCVDCAETDPIVLEFDHLDRSTKSFSVSQGVIKGMPFHLIVDEIAKCDVRCANCHRRKTYYENGCQHKNVDTGISIA